MAEVKGGAGLEAELDRIAKGLQRGAELRVGFLENATYPDGTSVALVAAVQNYGAPSKGIPPRPFFSNMVTNKSAEWPGAVAKALLTTDYDAAAALDIVGAGIAGQLKQSIIDTNSPPLSPRTIAAKGFDKPLIDTSHMMNSVDHEVEEL